MKADRMPTRGYRKGISDDKTAAPRRLHTRLPNAIHAALMADATARSMPASRLIRSLVAAHYQERRPDLPQSRGPGQAALRELCRIGNNLNQIAHQAHLMRLHLIERRALDVLDAIDAAARRLAG